MSSTRNIFLALLVLGAMIAMLGWPGRRQPPEWDIGTYLVIGNELNCGARLYVDVWDSKPPGIFATFALAQRITGYGGLEVYVLSVLAAMGTLLGVFAAASVQSRAAGLWAAALWTAICFDAPSGADLPNTEVFINCAMTWGMAILLRDNLRWRGVIVAGLSFALATLYKQVALAPIAAILLADVLCSRGRDSLTGAAIIILVIALVWSATFAYFAATERAWVFRLTIWDHPRFYAGSLLNNLMHAISPARLFPQTLLQLAPLAAAALLVLLPRPITLPKRAGVLLAAWAVGAFLAIAWPGKFLPHYYQFYFPVLAIAAAWGIDRLMRLPSVRPAFGATLGAVLALVLAAAQFSWATLDRNPLLQRKYPASLFPRALLDAREIVALLSADESFYTWSDEAWIYFIARRRPPAAGLWKQHTLEGPLAQWLSGRTVEQLRKHPPKLFIEWEALPSPAEHPITRLRDDLYTPLDHGKSRWPFRVYVRRGDP